MIHDSIYPIAYVNVTIHQELKLYWHNSYIRTNRMEVFDKRMIVIFYISAIATGNNCTLQNTCADANAQCTNYICQCNQGFNLVNGQCLQGGHIINSNISIDYLTTKYILTNIKLSR